MLQDGKPRQRRVVNCRTVKENNRANCKPGLLRSLLSVNMAATLYRSIIYNHNGRFITGNPQKVSKRGQGFDVVDGWLNRNQNEVSGFSGFKCCFCILARAVKKNPFNTIFSGF